MIMKKITINAYSYDEFKAQAAEQGLTVVRNVTPSWKSAGSPATTSHAFLDFAETALKNNRLTAAEGVGLAIVEENGSADTRERPYKFINHKNAGKTAYELVYEVVRKDTGAVVATAAKKDEAEKLAKKAMPEVKADMDCVRVKRAKDNKELAFTLEYTPSAGAKIGTYTVFGNERSI